MPSNERFMTIALPVRNEEKILESNLCAVREYVARCFQGKSVQVVIANNASRDRTEEIGRELASRFSDVSYIRLSHAGKGGAIREAWTLFPADIACFMDADLSTDLEALPRLARAVLDGADVAYGSRTHADSVVTRLLHRRCISLGYRTAVRAFTGHIGDIACGFKAVSSRIVRELLPRVIDNHFAFDRELVLLAAAYGYRTEAIPVEWVERRDPRRQSTVRLVPVIRNDLRHLWELRKKLHSLDKRRSP